MSFLIAMAGKGGTGKTTTAGLLLRYLVEQGKTPVLAVDADANSNFNEVLGLSVDLTVGQAREEMKKGGGLVDLTKDQLIEMRINQALVEADGFDLISMGQPEGPGCYCAANHMVARFMDILAKNYPFILMDNEAGMEHMSRLTTHEVDLLLLVSDPSWRSIQAAEPPPGPGPVLENRGGPGAAHRQPGRGGPEREGRGGDRLPGSGTGRLHPRGSPHRGLRQPGGAHLPAPGRFPSLKSSL